MVRTPEGSVINLGAKFEADISIRSKVIRVAKFRNLVTWPRPRLLMGHLMVRTPEGCVFDDCTKFEADICIRSKVIRGSQNLEIWSRDPGHAHFGVVLWFGRSRGPSSMSVPNLKRISVLVQKLLGGPKISKLGHVTLSHAPFQP